MMDELAFRRTVSLMKWQLAIPFVVNSDRYFVFMTATAQNSVSHSYVVAK
jgi:hypothetical protein